MEKSDANVVESVALSAALSAGVSSLDEQIFLVARCGKKFLVNAEVGKASSEYFIGLLEAGMKEAGKFSSIL
jgi:hypothetical protein